MKTVTVTVDDIIAGKVKSPLPLEIIPNYMGINLASVESLTWTKEGNQMVNLAINFIPDNNFISDEDEPRATEARSVKAQVMERDLGLLEKIRTVDGASFVFQPIGEVKKALQKYVEQGFFEKVIVTMNPDGDTAYVAFIYHGDSTLPDILYFDKLGGHYL